VLPLLRELSRRDCLSDLKGNTLRCESPSPGLLCGCPAPPRNAAVERIGKPILRRADLCPVRQPRLPIAFWPTGHARLRWFSGSMGCRTTVFLGV